MNSNISPSEAKQKLESDKTIILLDVRTKPEYCQGHIPGCMLIPLDVLDFQAAEKIKDKASTVFVYCRSGSRSSVACKVLAKLGYRNVFNLGGIINWPYDIEK